MKILNSEQLLFGQNSARFLLYSCGFKVGEIPLPLAGITYFPPEQKFNDDEMSMIIRIRFDFADGNGMEILRRVVQFYHDDIYRHSIRLVIPGECENGYDVKPYGQWRAWFLDDEPIGYGPVEAMFITSQRQDIAQQRYSDTQPWVVE